MILRQQKRLWVILSHNLTDKQLQEATNELGVEDIRVVPAELKAIWSSINPEGRNMPIDDLLPILGWLKEARKDDYALIQGEFGATVWLVREAKKLGLVPIYATTRRVVKERSDEQGNVITERVFQHVNFRFYP